VQVTGWPLDQRDQEPSAGQRGQRRLLRFLARPVGREDGRDARVRGAVVSGEPLAAGVQPSHGSDPTPAATATAPANAGPRIHQCAWPYHKIITLARGPAGS
jgi:hypothetical protein